MPPKARRQKRKAKPKAAPAPAPSRELAIFTDIHSNLHALEAVLAVCQSRGIRQFCCLGDIVGYGAFPAECLKRLRSLDALCVLGNHDDYVARESLDGDLNDFAKIGIAYSIAHLTAAARKWLGQRPEVATASSFTLVHSALPDPLAWDYIFDTTDAKPTLLLQTTPLCFFGHTHIPQLFVSESSPPPEQLAEYKYRFHPQGRALLNPGSVGQPRGGDPRARFAVFDPLELTVEFVPVEYDTAAAAKAIMQAGLPAFLGERLLEGV